jgi:hypothetical protein
MKGLYERHGYGGGRSVEFAKDVVVRSVVKCPGCGGDTDDAGERAKPRWGCRDVKCAFRYGWFLDFVDGVISSTTYVTKAPTDTAKHPQLTAVPFDVNGQPNRSSMVEWTRL